MKLIMENWRKFAKEEKKVIQERFTPIGQGVVPGQNLVYYLGTDKSGQLFYGTAEAEDPEEMQLAGKQAQSNAKRIDNLKVIQHEIDPVIKKKAEKLLSTRKASAAPNTNAVQTVKQPAKNNSDFQAPQIKQIGSITYKKAGINAQRLLATKKPKQMVKAYFLMTYAMMLKGQFNKEYKEKLTNLLINSLTIAKIPKKDHAVFINTLMSGKIQKASNMMTTMFKQQ